MRVLSRIELRDSRVGGSFVSPISSVRSDRSSVSNMLGSYNRVGKRPVFPGLCVRM
jgi:hypothetical protein